MKITEIELPGRSRYRFLRAGDEVTLKTSALAPGQRGGRYVFKYVYEPDGSLAVWGPVESGRAQCRAITVDQIQTVHRGKRAR